MIFSMEQCPYHSHPQTPASQQLGLQSLPRTPANRRWGKTYYNQCFPTPAIKTEKNIKEMNTFDDLSKKVDNQKFRNTKNFKIKIRNFQSNPYQNQNLVWTSLQASLDSTLLNDCILRRFAQRKRMRLLDHHAGQHMSLPKIKPSSNSGFPVAWITEPAIDPSHQN